MPSPSLSVPKPLSMAEARETKARPKLVRASLRTVRLGLLVHAISDKAMFLKRFRVAVHYLGNSLHILSSCCPSVSRRRMDAPARDSCVIGPGISGMLVFGRM
jgi:hypothetical protein